MEGREGERKEGIHSILLNVSNIYVSFRNFLFTLHYAIDHFKAVHFLSTFQLYIYPTLTLRSLILIFLEVPPLTRG